MQWKLNEGHGIPSDFKFRQITGWDDNFVLVLGSTSLPTKGSADLFRYTFRNGGWDFSSFDIDGHYAQYKAHVRSQPIEIGTSCLPLLFLHPLCGGGQLRA